MQNSSIWFDKVTINKLELPSFGVNSLSQFAPNKGGVTFDNSASLPTFDFVPRGQRGSYAALGFNSNAAKPTNIQSAEITLSFREGTTQKYSLNTPNNLVAVPSMNYDVTRVTLQILRTTDGQPPKNVEIIILACRQGMQSRKISHHLLLMNHMKL
jgi:hypothetical protein